MLREREDLYGTDITKLICNFEELPEPYEVEEVTPNHCMKYIIKIGNDCEADCSLLGLKPFDEFRTKNEDDEKKIYVIAAKNIYHFL